jgi:hypothetical protein
MKVITNFAILLCAGFWFGAGIGMASSGNMPQLPHVSIHIDWEV